MGNTAGLRNLVHAHPVHPHARGEHPPLKPLDRIHSGSSPRPWGTQRVARRPARWPRFIPTPVGNTPASNAHATSTAVHPHARGEHVPRRRPSLLTAGSSPRPWGTREEHPARHPRHRFIPTPVGNTPNSSAMAASPPVHPHARGEHSRMTMSLSLADGSSPRPWGTLDHLWSVPFCRRFIPTPVGNTPDVSTR